MGPRPLLVTFVIYGTQRTALFNVPGNAPASCSSIFLFFFKKRKLALILAPSLTLSFTTIFSHYHIPDQMRKFFTQVLAPSTVLLLEPILISFISNFYVFFCLLLALFLLLLLLLLHTSDFTEPAQKSNRAERPARFRRFKQTKAVQHQKFLNHEGKKKKRTRDPKKKQKKSKRTTQKDETNETEQQEKENNNNNGRR